MKFSMNQFLSLFMLLIVGCASESNQAIKVEQSKSEATSLIYRGKKHPIMVGKFDNRSGFMRGIFVDGPDRLSSQAKKVSQFHSSPWP